MGDAFEADWWPLEVAVVWVACGDRSLCIEAADLVAARRSFAKRPAVNSSVDGHKVRFPAGGWPPLGGWLAAHGGLAQGLEVVEGAMYRKERRGRQSHPIHDAFAETSRLLTLPSFSATGCRGAAKRARIPPRAWKSALVVDHRRFGLVLQSSEETPDEAWQQIHVRAAPFKALKAKRGRRPAGLGQACLGLLIFADRVWPSGYG